MKYLFYIVIFFFIGISNTFSDVDRDLEKVFKKYEKNINRIQKRINNLNKPNSKEAELIDQSLKEIKSLTNYSLKNLNVDKKENLLNSLKVLDKYLGDISKSIPSEVTRDVSNQENFDKQSLTKMANFSKKIKTKKIEKNADILVSMDNLQKDGLDVFKTNEKLIDLEIQTINEEVINEVTKNVNSLISKTNSEKLKNSIYLNIPKSLDKPDFIDMETNNKFYSDLATMRVLQKYDYSWEKNNYRISVGRPVDEALQVKDMVYDKALAFGFSDVKANKLANNAYSAYYDMFFHADEISETVRAKGGSWEEADAAIDKWLLDPKNKFNEWAFKFYKVEDEGDNFLPNPEALEKWFKSIGDQDISDYQLSSERLDSEAMARTVSYLSQDFMDGQSSESDPYKEADEILNYVKKMALDKGFSEKKASIIAQNTSSKYLDFWLDATLVMEKSLAAGNSYSIADQEVEKWAMQSDNIYNDWFTRWGDPEDENKDWLPNSQTFGKYLDQIKDQEIDKVNISDTRKDLEVSMKVYENIKYNDKLQKWEGDIFNDAKKVSDAFYNRALNDFNLSKEEANKIKSNTYDNYVSTWLEGTYVSETVRYEGGSWEDADKAVDTWFNKSKYKDYWLKNEKSFGIVIEEDDNGKITIIFKELNKKTSTPKLVKKTENKSNKKVEKKTEIIKEDEEIEDKEEVVTENKEDEVVEKDEEVTKTNNDISEKSELTDKESKTENIQDTSQDIIENNNAIEETKNIDVTEEIKNIDVVEETKNIDIAEEIKNIDIAQELDLKSITKELDLKSLTEGELREAIAEAANPSGEAVEGTVAGSGKGYNPPTGPQYGPGQNQAGNP